MLKISVFIIYLFIFITSSAYAQTPAEKTSTTPTPSPATNLSEQISDLKEKIASRVASLKLVEKKGFIGIVSEVNSNQIIIKNSKKESRSIEVDELTKFTGSDPKSTFGISDIKTNMYISAVGRYNKQSQILQAREIVLFNRPVFISGKIKSIDSDGFSIKIIGSDKQEYQIDVESSTKTQEYTKEGGIIKSGFSKLENNDFVIATGLSDKSNSKKITGIRITVLKDLTQQKNDSASPTPEEVSEDKQEDQ